ncbi:hypothetical protein COLO4_02637 [Corchorus olitorius]|uniref:Uncharacterized protein n=1 Tax=Corchorus olitorius TaxID=93759 RepID=A0A1R3L0L2_9ROSI|nr:hypothetical protein COLO4_02637 [Corchorus olitorius]
MPVKIEIVLQTYQQPYIVPVLSHRSGKSVHCVATHGQQCVHVHLGACPRYNVLGRRRRCSAFEICTDWRCASRCVSYEVSCIWSPSDGDTLAKGSIFNTRPHARYQNASSIRRRISAGYWRSLPSLETALVRAILHLNQTFIQHLLDKCLHLLHAYVTRYLIFLHQYIHNTVHCCRLRGQIPDASADCAEIVILTGLHIQHHFSPFISLAI